MKKFLWLVLICLITTVLVLSSCTQNVPEASTEDEIETAETARQTPPQTPEPTPASFTVSGLTITPAEVTTGSSITIEVLVTNMGELSGTYDVTLKIDETVEATEKVTLAGGASQKVTFSKTKLTAKTYSVNIGGQTGTFIVRAPSLPPLAPPRPPPPTLPPMSAFQKGMNLIDSRSFDAPVPVSPPLYEPAATNQSLRNLAATGTNWLSLLVVVGQETIKSTDIFYKPPATASDEELRRVIDMAHALGMRVALNPFIMLSQDPTHVSIHIGTTFTTEEQWRAWFASYQQFILHYATLARDARADMFFIGQELPGTVHREADWRRIAEEVRQVYKGPIIYEATTVANPSSSEELRIKWWDAVDYIGVLGYFPLTDKKDPTVEELKAAWVQKGYLSRLEGLSQQWQKPLIISEIGYLSVDGTNTTPVNFRKLAKAPLDLQEQADCYEAALEVLWGKPWLAGIYWWHWQVNPNAGWYEQGKLVLEAQRYCSPQGKPAEAVLKRFYLAK